jgi:hypothetical protein
VVRAPLRTLWPCILQCAQGTWLRGRVLAFDIIYKFLSNGAHDMILVVVLRWPLGYNANHCSKLLLMKDFFPFLSNYAHFFIVTFVFFSL